jgi:hypothetical protein
MTLSECIAQAARLLDGRAAELARLFLAGRGRRRRSVE